MSNLNTPQEEPASLEDQVKDFHRREFIRWCKLAETDVDSAFRDFTAECRAARKHEPWTKAFDLKVEDRVGRLHTIGQLLAGIAEIPPPPPIKGDPISYLFILTEWADASSMLVSDLHKALMRDPYSILHAVALEIDAALIRLASQPKGFDIEIARSATLLTIATFRGKATHARKVLVDLDLPPVPVRHKDLERELGNFKAWYKIALSRIEAPPEDSSSVGNTPGEVAIAAAGNWSAPMSRTEILRRLIGPNNLRIKDPNALIAQYGELRQFSARRWQICLDKMTTEVRRRFDEL